MNQWKSVSCVLGLAMVVSLGINAPDVHAAPAPYADISIENLNVSDMIITSAEKEVASPFYKKGLSTAEDCVYIRKEPETDGEIIGKLYTNAGFDLLDEDASAADGWKHIRSGNCEGYVSVDYVVTGKAAEDYAKKEEAAKSYAKPVAETLDIKEKADEYASTVATAGAGEELKVLESDSAWTKVAKDGIEGYVKNADVEVGVDYITALTLEEEAAQTEETGQTSENNDVKETESTQETEDKNEADTKETQFQTEETEISQSETEVSQSGGVSISAADESVWTTDGVNVRSSYSTDASVVGTLASGAKLTRTGICDNGWSQVSYNGSTAYIHSDYLTTEEPEQKTDNSNSNSGSSVGEQMVAYGRQFLGNPYVYGGTSLTNGADCSGYVQSIYSYFGYSIPRTATAQLYYGRQISMDELRPGDLVGYAYDGEIEHVAMYAGNGTVIHASTESTGIIETDIDYCGSPYILTRIIE